MSRFSPSRFTVAITALIAAGALVLAGCGGDDDDSSSTATTEAAATAEPAAAETPNVVTITAADFSFDLPKQIPAGRTEIVLENSGAETHQAALVRLADGATAEQFLGALAADFGSAAQYGTFVAGPNEAVPAGSNSVVSDLEPGNYLVLCLIPSPADGTPHVIKGMQAPLQVVEADGATPSATVDEDAPTLTLKDFSFDLPDDYDGGPLQVVNNGSQNHEVVIVGLPDGVEIADVVESTVPIFTPAKGPAPYTDVAGTTMIAPGGTTFLDPQLPPGRYALLCFLPDTTNPTTDHLHNGMATEFTVS